MFSLFTQHNIMFFLLCAGNVAKMKMFIFSNVMIIIIIINVIINVIIIVFYCCFFYILVYCLASYFH